MKAWFSEALEWVQVGLLVLICPPLVAVASIYVIGCFIVAFNFASWLAEAFLAML